MVPSNLNIANAIPSIDLSPASGLRGCRRKASPSLLAADWSPENYTSPYQTPESDREIIVILGPWKFHRGDIQKKNPYDQCLNDSSWEAVTVPHTWNAKDGQDGGDNY